MHTSESESQVRVDCYKTRDGRTFRIPRKARPSRRFQKPRITGGMVDCPFCPDYHDILEYTVGAGKKGERKVRTWRCPKTGTLSLNMGRKFQEYLDSITVKQIPSQAESVESKESSDSISPTAEAPPLEGTLSRELEARRRAAVQKLEEVVEDG